jgi:uncharacterized phage-like protein YoqJ
MIIAGTGHRPDKLGGYDAYATKKVVDLATHAINCYQPTRVISGMAQGWDMSLAQAAINLGIPLHAYVPFEGQEQVWPLATRLYYKALLKLAEKVVICSEGGFTRAAMQYRNIQMVNDCDLLVALWNGTPGGTTNCINYAQFMKRPIVNLWTTFIGEPDVQENAGDDGVPTFVIGPDWLGA